MQLCKKHKISRKKIIDIGAGYGTFCKIIQDNKFFEEVIGKKTKQKITSEEPIMHNMIEWKVKH